MPNRAAVFIDGAYLDNVLRHEFSFARLDFSELAQHMCGNGADLFRTYYYDCLPYQSQHPTDEERRLLASKRKFFYTLDSLSRFTVRQGKLALRGYDGGKPQFQQKRVDILMAVDLVRLAAKQTIQEAVILSGDSDLIPAVEVAKSEGVLIRLFHGESPHNDLWQAADERTKLDQKIIDSVLR